MADPENPDYYPQTTYRPAGDWSNFYGYRFGEANTPDSPGASNDRLGVIPGYRDEPLQEPYILWDSRDISIGDTVVTNHGTAGTKFDLKLGGEFNEGDVSSPWRQLFPYGYVYGYKTLNWDNSYATTPGAPGGFPSGEDDIGGDTCAGAYTMMIPIGPNYKLEDVIEAEQIARGANSGDGYMYTEIDFLVNFDAADGGGTNIRQNFLGDNNDDHFDLFHEWYDTNNYCQWFPTSPNATYPPNEEGWWDGTYVQGKLITIIADPWAGRYDVFLDEELVKVYDMWGDYDPTGSSNHWENFYDWMLDCRQNESGQNPGTFKEIFLYYYGHEGGTKYFSNTAWRTVPGVAFFRGIPTKADMRYWKEYFMPEGQAYQPYGMRYDIRRTPGASTSPHTATFTVPDNGYDPNRGLYPVDKLVLNIAPAGGGGMGGIGLIDGISIWAEFDVAAGDEITVELGGGGAVYRSTGLGGWPNGGNGGLSAASGFRGGGGGGSTKIYRNGVLYIHMPGGGGGAVTVPTGTPSSSTWGHWVSQPITEGLDGTSRIPPGGGTFPGMGQMASVSAPGAGGWNGGSSGSGSSGGDGTTQSIPSYTGGGGGGGGHYGGGGGGYDPGNITYGGGAGSWYKHANVSLYNRTIIGTGGISGQGSDAYVDIYYW